MAMADEGVNAHPARLDSDALLAGLAQFQDRYRAMSARPPEDQFVVDHIEHLTGLGLLTAPLPLEQGGLGWGTEAHAAGAICTALRLLGQASLALGRVFEGHVNAIRLLHRWGEPALFRATAADVRGGSLIGLWVTSFADPVRMGEPGPNQPGPNEPGPNQPGLSHHGPAQPVSCRVSLCGTLDVCSGAGIAGHAVIMVTDAEGGEHLAYVPTSGLVVVGEQRVALMGMRAARTAPVRIAGQVSAAAIFAGPGTYMAEPDFSGGAWRTSAVTVGGLEALVHATLAQLAARGRSGDPHQRARIGQMVMARETALLWIARAAALAEAEAAQPGPTIACVNLARLAIERCCLEVIPLVQRSLGLACMQQTNPVEQMMRDLSTYLRQPAGDEVLAAVTDWYLPAATA